MAVPSEEAAHQPASAQVIGNAFAQQYYHILHHSPGLVHRFYQDISKVGRPEEDGTLSITTTMQAIDEKIVSLNYADLRAEIKSVDAQESFNGGVHVFVTGNLKRKDDAIRNFAQSFFLAPQDRGYFVLNDMFRYVDGPHMNPTLVTNVVPPDTDEPVEKSHVSEQNTPYDEESITEEVYNPLENGDAQVVEEVEEEVEEEVKEEVSISEVVGEVQDEAPVVESNAKIDEAPKKSYASIVRDLKESGATISPLPHAPKEATSKHADQANPTFAPEIDGVSSFETLEDGNSQDGEADGHSIYIKGLPMNATDSMLEEVFKKFGTIKIEGIQVRSKKQQGFCFGFVEYEEASSVQKALEASPVAIGGRRAFVEEKRSKNSQGNNGGKVQSGRGMVFRNEGIWARGRGYNYNGYRGEFSSNSSSSSRSEYGNKGGNWSSNGGRLSRTGGVAAAAANKNTAPRVSANA